MACVIAAAFVAPPALAQDAPAAAPAPSPSRTPTIITLPGVVPERYSLPGATPAPMPTSPPAATPSPTPAPTALAAPPRVQAPRAERRPVPAAAQRSAGPSAQAPAAATSEPLPASTPTAAAPSPVAVPPPAPVPRPGLPGWLWMLIGGAATALAAGAFWLLTRRRPAIEEFEEAIEDAPAPAPVQPSSPPPIPPPPRAAPVPPPPVQRPRSDPFDLIVRPVRIELGEREAVLDFELLVGNLQPGPAEGIRVALAMISANPDQDAILAGFHRGPPGEAAGDPFDLAPASGIRIPARLALPRERVHVVQLAGRPMFVAMVLVDLRWRSGLSIRRFGADFMIGAAGQGGKIGPIWLDRGPSASALGVTRYLGSEAVAA